ncbi:PhzF family phenazine biosynthesis protein [Glycomyces arizonensis]|uniref:PhzF family phenazine biosynthesis protein n=1 Tax=Glycomyces arizonensis TaxID=256035 RepID=UPI0003FF54D1|nr:PhzF family phenazine biosynthesis protein [Glycomyces arizonensis]
MLPFAIVDVFALPSPTPAPGGAGAAPMPYTGNQLAVVYEAEALTTEQMQAIAVEFGYSETVFVLPPTTGEADYRARIFTPTEELPFAGHPTVGAALAAVGSGRVEPRGATVVQECAAGLMTLELDGSAAKLTSTAIEVGLALDPAAAAAACGLDASRVIGTPQTAGAGYAHNFVRLADADVAAAVDTPGHLEKVYLFSFDPETNAVHGRLFHLGVGEDPATGSAALALGVHLVDQGLVSGDGTHTYAIAQGAEMGRPSAMLGEVVVEGGKAVSVSVTGSVAMVAKGELVTLPSGR